MAVKHVKARREDRDYEDLVRLYRGLPERQREKLLAVVRATASALSPGEGGEATKRDAG